jgi:phosphoglycerate kinase
MNTIDNINFNHKKALVRVDFNVPLNENFEVTDNTRIKAALPTIQKILQDGGSVILMSHLGRPKGNDEKYSLKHIISELEKLTGKKILFVNDCIGDSVKEKVKHLNDGEILLLENLRFYPEEKKGDLDFAKALSELGADYYINDAFGTAHRAHASTAVIARFFDSKHKAAGKLLEKEVTSIRKALDEGKKPVTAIIGGAKISSKIGVIENLLSKVDNLIIVGGMAFTFLKAKGNNIGDSIVEDDKLDLAKSIMQKAREKGVHIILPTDVVIADKFSNDAQTRIVPVNEIPNHWQGLDIGPETRKIIDQIIQKSKTIIWNGPAGVFEFEKFAHGTESIGKSIGKASVNGAYSLVGGGDSVAAVKKLGLEDQISYISTGGGALLEMLEGKTLPGIAALSNN